MIAKAKAISHGGRAIEYAMREAKKGDLVGSNLVQNDTPKDILAEFVQIQQYNTRCKNKFIRMEIGIAPQDESKLTPENLTKICNEFSKKMGFKNHQWIACTHKDTDNLHIHMIVNRIAIDGKVYNTDFISRRAGQIAEEISKQMGLTIANEVERKSKYKPEIISFERAMERAKIEQAAKAIISNKPKSLKEFTEQMKKKGITVSEAVNKKGNTYGLRFTGYRQTFKASQIGKEFGYRSLLMACKQNALQQTNRTEQSVPKTAIAETLSGIGGLLSGLLSPNSNTPSDNNENELLRPKKRKKKRRYGRQQ